MVTGEPYYGRDETAAVPQYSSTSQGSNVGTPGTGNQTTSQAQQTVSNVTNQVQQAASSVAGQAADTAQSIAMDQRQNAAQSLTAVSNAVSQMGDQLRQNDQTAPIAGVIDAAATQIQHVATYLQHHNVQQMVDEVRDVARREPALFLGGAFVLGLLAARFLKASPEVAQPSAQTTGQYQTGQYQSGRFGTYRTSGYRPMSGYNRPYGVYGYGNYGRASGRAYGNQAYSGPDYRQPTYGEPGYGATYAPTENSTQGPAYREGNAIDTGTYGYDAGAQG